MSKCLTVFILLLAHCTAYAQFPQITVYDLDGNAMEFPTNEKQIVFMGSSMKARFSLRNWGLELEKRPSLTKGASLRGIAILPEWMKGGLAQPIALLYLKARLPEQFHKSVYVYFASPEKAQALFNLPTNTTEDLHLFYLNDKKNILVYTYGDPSNQKISTIDAFKGI